MNKSDFQNGNGTRKRGISPKLASRPLLRFDVTSVRYRGAVLHQSLGSRSAPQVGMSANHQTPAGFYNVACETPLGFILRYPAYPGCAARPWALMLNAFGITLSPRFRILRAVQQ